MLAKNLKNNSPGKLALRLAFFLAITFIFFKLDSLQFSADMVKNATFSIETLLNFLLLSLLFFHLHFSLRRHTFVDFFAALGCGLFLLQNIVRYIYLPTIDKRLQFNFSLSLLGLGLFFFALAWLIGIFSRKKFFERGNRKRNAVLFLLASILFLFFFYQISAHSIPYFHSFSFHQLSMHQIIAVAGILSLIILGAKLIQLFFQNDEINFANYFLAVLFFLDSFLGIYFGHKFDHTIFLIEANAILGLAVMIWTLFRASNQYLLEEQELRYRVEMQLAEKDRDLKIWRERIQSAAAGYAEIDRDGNIIYANDKFAANLKAKSTSLLGKNLTAFLNEESRLKFENEILHSKSRSVQFDLTLKINGRKSLPVRIFAVRMKNGWQIAVFENAADLLQRDRLADYAANLESEIQSRTKDLEAHKDELEKVRKFYETLLGAMNEIVMVVNRKSNCTYINPYGKRLLGFEAKKLTGKRLPNFFDDVNKLQRNYGDAVQVELRDYEAPVKTRDGRKISISWNVRYLFDENGKNIGAMCIGREVDEKKAAQQKLQTEQELLKNELAQKERELVRKTEWMKAILSLDTKLTQKAAPQKYLDLTLQILRKLGWQKVFISQKVEDKNQFKILAYAGISKSKVRDFVRQRYFLYQGAESYFFEKNKIGNSYLINFASEKAAPLTGESWTESLALVIPIERKNNLSGFVTLFQPAENKIPDEETATLFEQVVEKGISLYLASRTFQQTLRKLKELERTSQFRSDFFHVMAHELRTPLNSIISLTDVLLSELSADLAAKNAKQLQAIRRNGEELLNLINNILDLAKSESEKLSLSEHYFSTERFSEKITNFISPLCQNKGLSLIFKTGKVPKYLFSDEEKIERILLNLLSNAVKYTQRGKILWELDFDKKDRMLNVRIKDSGAGLDKNEINAIFQAYSRADSFAKSKVSGTGLGLAITKRFLDLLGGKIDVDSKPGKGTTFRVSIPVRDYSDRSLPENVLKKKSRSEKKKHKTSSAKSSIKILMVDDNPENQFAVESILSDQGYQLFFASDGRQGVKLARKIQPDLILMDMMMPKMDGYEATEKIRQQKKLAKVPIIAITAKSIAEDKNQAIKAGCDDYLSKPFTMKQMIETIEKWTGNSNG